MPTDPNLKRKYAAARATRTTAMREADDRYRAEVAAARAAAPAGVRTACRDMEARRRNLLEQAQRQWEEEVVACLPAAAPLFAAIASAEIAREQAHSAARATEQAERQAALIAHVVDSHRATRAQLGASGDITSVLPDGTTITSHEDGSCTVTAP